MPSHDFTPFVLPLHYDNHLFRVLLDDEQEWWWVARDVGNYLKLADVHTSLRRVSPLHKGKQNLPTLGGDQEMSIVDECGFYALVWQSNKKEAEGLIEWTYGLLKRARRQGIFSFPGMPPAFPKHGDSPYTVDTRDQGHEGVTSSYTPDPTPIVDSSRMIAPHTHAGERSTDEDFHFDITPNLVRIWKALEASTEWLTARNVTERAKTNFETTKKILRNLQRVELLDVLRARTFWYRVSESSPHRYPEFYRELKQMQGIFEKQGTLFTKSLDWKPEDFR